METLGSCFDYKLISKVKVHKNSDCHIYPQNTKIHLALGQFGNFWCLSFFARHCCFRPDFGPRLFCTASLHGNEPSRHPWLASRPFKGFSSEFFSNLDKKKQCGMFERAVARYHDSNSKKTVRGGGIKKEERTCQFHGTCQHQLASTFASFIQCSVSENGRHGPL